ncbi:dockerin type I domain-containing protein [Ruminococcus flavefaciens]|uniref:dockerin type I domain-containing protein n=1 Tax=Ruminococcus flavefaciens TaxID=1265 RepID=UPI0004656342|nr:dockerin type I domain-containing protein [Ruminococcus flavefaciens]
MDRKLKNAIRESFVFPESQHKEEFFRQVGATCAEKRKRRFPVASRLAAAAAALLIGIGIYGASRLRTDFNGGGTEPVTQPVTDTTEDTTAQSTGNTAEVTTAASSSAVSKTTSSGTAKTTAKAQTTAPPRTNTTRASVTAAQARTTAPTVTAGVETTTISEYEEGSVTMKKMIAFLSAMGIATTATPTGVNASYSSRCERIFTEMYYYSFWQEEGWYYDFNDDGEFDLKDLFEIELYAEHMDECREKYGKDTSKYKEMYELYDGEAAKNIKIGIAINPHEQQSLRKKKVEDIEYLFVNVGIGGANDVARYYLYLHGEYPTNEEIREVLRDYDFVTIDGPDHIDKFIEYMEELRNEIDKRTDDEYTEEQLDCFRRFESGEAEKDLNGDGKFDYYDSYDLLYYIVYQVETAKGIEDAVDILPAEVSERIKQYGDIDLNGKVDEDDYLNQLLYLDKKGLIPVSYHQYYYEKVRTTLERKKTYLTGEYALGDVDNSGAVNAIDASLVLDYYSRASTGQSESFDDAQKKAADADKNGSINAVDASLILSYYVYTSTANGTVEPFETFINS